MDRPHGPLPRDACPLREDLGYGPDCLKRGEMEGYPLGMRPSTGIEIRALCEEDYDAVIGVWEGAGLGFRPDGRDARTSFHRELGANTAVFLGSWVDGQLAGVILGTHDGRKGWVNRLAVLPQYQRCGLGRALIGEFERRIREQGIEMMACLVEGENAPSRAFFEALGYIEHPRISYHAKRYSPVW